MTTEEELSGLLNLALIALKQLIKDNGFIHVDNVNSIQKEYNQNASAIEEFLNSQCELDVSDRDNYTICRDLYRSYILHCKRSNKPSVSDNAFGSHLIAKGIKKERRSNERNKGILLHRHFRVVAMTAVLPRLSMLPLTYHKVQDRPT